jgi:hypothetical protein
MDVTVILSRKSAELSWTAIYITVIQLDVLVNAVSVTLEIFRGRATATTIDAYEFGWGVRWFTDPSELAP